MLKHARIVPTPHSESKSLKNMDFLQKCEVTATLSVRNVDS